MILVSEQTTEHVVLMYPLGPHIGYIKILLPKEEPYLIEYASRGAIKAITCPTDPKDRLLVTETESVDGSGIYARSEAILNSDPSHEYSLVLTQHFGLNTVEAIFGGDPTNKNSVVLKLSDYCEDRHPIVLSMVVGQNPASEHSFVTEVVETDAGLQLTRRYGDGEVVTRNVPKHLVWKRLDKL